MYPKGIYVTMTIGKHGTKESFWLLRREKVERLFDYLRERLERDRWIKKVELVHGEALLKGKPLLRWNYQRPKEVVAGDYIKAHYTWTGWMPGRCHGRTEGGLVMVSLDHSPTIVFGLKPTRVVRVSRPKES